MLPHVIVRSLGDLPDLSHAEKIYLDYETDSGNPNPGGAEAHPWRGAKIALVGISDGSRIWTVATDRMKRGETRLNTNRVLAWLADTLNSPRIKRYIAQWIRIESNLSRAEGFPLRREAEWYCTEIAAHHFHDMFEEYNLEFLAEKVLGFTDPATWKQRLTTFFRDAKLNKGQTPGNYAEVPAEILHQYTALDVWASLSLEHAFEVGMDSSQLIAMHQDFEANKVLTDMNYEGVRTDKQRLLIANHMHLTQLVRLGETLQKLVGYDMNPLSHPDMCELLLNKEKLPVLRWNASTSPKEGADEFDPGVTVQSTPSFDDDTLDLYLERPEVKAKESLVKIIQTLSEYKTIKKRLGFVESYLENDEFAGGNGQFGRLHGEIHPCRAKGGRTTMARPNLQQCDEFAKLYLIPEEGDGFFDADASQIEYRMMAHIMQDMGLIRGYRGSRDFDIHKFVQDWLKIVRRAAKVINFGTAFNMGVKKLSRELSHMTGGAVSFEQAEAILVRYFTEIVPNLRGTRREMERIAKERGWIKNYFGRRSHLAHRNSYKAFNRWVQGTAADVVKNRMVACDKAIREVGLRDRVQPKLLVHDELIWSIRDQEPVKKVAFPILVNTLEDFKSLRVPVWWEAAWSTGAWYDVAKVKDAKDLKPQDFWGVPVKVGAA